MSRKPPISEYLVHDGMKSINPQEPPRFSGDSEKMVIEYPESYSDPTAETGGLNDLDLKQVTEGGFLSLPDSTSQPDDHVGLGTCVMEEFPEELVLKCLHSQL